MLYANSFQKADHLSAITLLRDILSVRGHSIGKLYRKPVIGAAHCKPIKCKPYIFCKLVMNAGISELHVITVL